VEKAEQLLNSTQKQILMVPWTSNPKSRLVKSSSSPQPHMVTTDPKKNQVYRCDDKCPMYKGFSLCSHVIAAAEDNGELGEFLEYVKEFCGPNLSAIANTGMPSGSGRKGGVEKRKRSKAGTVQSRSVRQCLQALTPSTMPSATSKTSPSTSCVVSLSLSTHSGQITQSSSQTPATPSCYITPSCIKTKTSATQTL